MAVERICTALHCKSFCSTFVHVYCQKSNECAPYPRTNIKLSQNSQLNERAYKKRIFSNFAYIWYWGDYVGYSSEIGVSL
eukprot:5014412-Amphidinium_carterae.1